MAIERYEGYVLICDGCGHNFDDDGYWPVYSTEDDARGSLDAFDAREVDGKVFCEECGAEREEGDDAR